MAKIYVGHGKALYSDGSIVKYDGKHVVQWSSDPKRWSNQHGSEIKDFKGKSLADVAKVLGYSVGAFLRGRVLAGSEALFFVKKI